MEREKQAPCHKRRAALAVAAVVLAGLLAAVQPAAAWEDRAHRLIIVRAVESLPYPLRAFIESNRFALAELCQDPGQWGEDAPLPHHSYINLDHYGRYPFAELPRDYNRAVRKFGRRQLDEQGTLPWQVGTYSLKLEEAFRAQQWDQVKLYAAILARYVSESHDPFNTTVDADGGNSGQSGVNGRFVGRLVERYQMFLIIRPGGAFKIEDPTLHAFGMALEANTWVDNILFSDSQARSGKTDYNDEYYNAFYDSVGAILVRQLSGASQSVGSYWYSAWVNAGRPALPPQ
jgi:hypothetical protein